ncbi:max-like protein X [Ixodes scapularis]
MPEPCFVACAAHLVADGVPWDVRNVTEEQDQWNMAEAKGTDQKYDVDWEQKNSSIPSPTLPGVFSFSRTSSTGSIDNILTSSSAHNTDDEDSDHKSTISYKERRREAHTQAEQKRRDAIKKGYDDLQMLVPTCQQDSSNSFKMSKATVLQKSIDYITFLLQQKKKHEEELNALRKEVVALQIMKANYEQIVLVHQSQPGQNNNQISDEVKFQVFQAIGDSLFTSFNSSISVANFAELSGGVFSWLEEYCKPQTLKDMVLQILSQLNQTFGSRHS